MVWLVGVIVLVLMVYSVEFRKFAFGIAIIVPILIGLLIFFDLKSTENKQEESRRRISIKEIAFQDLDLKKDYSSDYKITARIKNNSRQFAVTGIGIKFSFQDCEINTSQLNCVTIQEYDGNFGLSSEGFPIPAGQARDFSGSIIIGKMHPKGKLVWSYKISYIEGK